MSIKSRKTKCVNFVLNTLVTIIAIIFAVPLYVTFVNVFKQTKEIASAPMSFPMPPIIDNITNVLNSPNVQL